MTTLTAKAHNPLLAPLTEPDVRRALLVNGTILTGLALLTAAAAFFKPEITTALFHGHVAAFETALQRLFLLTALAQVPLTAALLHRRTRHGLVRFFWRQDHALNLAVLRIVVFALLLLGYGENAAWYAALPEALRFPPFGIGRLADLGLERLLYFSPAQVEVAYAVFLLFCVTGLLGLLSRTSALVVVLLGVFPLAAPEFYGKVNHGFHHVLWFAALLSVSRCGDALALDAARRAWRRPGEAARWRGPSRAYGLPLCFAWLLIGLLYFFPGFWKAWRGGYDWVLGDQLKFIMHTRWFSLQPWMPLLRIDAWPVVYRALGLATILFEVFFVLLVFTRRTRVVAAVVGLGFHVGTYVMMRISFYPLMVCYVVFFDWQRILCRIGRRFFPEPLQVSYGKGSRFHRRAFAVLSTFDVLRRIELIDAVSHSDQVSPSSSTPELGDVHATVAGRRWHGVEAYRAAVRRIPPLWPFYPVLYVQPLYALALKWARRSVGAPVSVGLRPGPTSAGAGGRSLIPVTLVAVILFTGNAFCGLKRMTSAWPFACHPTFSGNYGPTSKTIMLGVESGDGKGAIVSLQGLIATSTPMSNAHVEGLLKKTLSTRNATRRQAQLEALWGMLVEENPALASISKIQFYQATFYDDPELVRSATPPIDQELLYTFEPGPDLPAALSQGSN